MMIKKNIHIALHCFLAHYLFTNLLAIAPTTTSITWLELTAIFFIISFIATKKA